VEGVCGYVMKQMEISFEFF